MIHIIQHGVIQQGLTDFYPLFFIINGTYKCRNHPTNPGIMFSWLKDPSRGNYIPIDCWFCKEELMGSLKVATNKDEVIRVIKEIVAEYPELGLEL